MTCRCPHAVFYRFANEACRRRPTPFHKPVRSHASASNRIPDDRKYASPIVTDDGVKVFQANPNTASSGPGLTWGSVLWPSGACLAKYLAWTFDRSGGGNRPANDIRKTRILEMGCGTGVVGLTCAALGARHVTLTDSESALWPILRKSIEANSIDAERIDIHNLDWRDTTTFLDPANDGNRYDLIVAADVLYAGMDGLFARALASHLPSGKEVGGKSPPHAIIACPYRTDSPLYNFFGIAGRLGLALDRLEDQNGDAAGAAAGTNASEAFDRSQFVPLGDERENGREATRRWGRIANEPEFSPLNRDRIQIFRVRRISGTASEARAIRRVGRL